MFFDVYFVAFLEKGKLQDGIFVAVKVLSVELESMRGEREFVSEIAALSDIKHENLVNLRGCCVDGANRLLVYDYMENNSLSQTFLGNFFVFLYRWNVAGIKKKGSPLNDTSRVYAGAGEGPHPRGAM